MAGKTDYKNNWQKENKDRLLLLLPKGGKEKMKARASEAGAKSLNAYIVGLIEKDMGPLETEE